MIHPLQFPPKQVMLVQTHSNIEIPIPRLIIWTMLRTPPQQPLHPLPPLQRRRRRLRKMYPGILQEKSGHARHDRRRVRGPGPIHGAAHIIRGAEMHRPRRLYRLAHRGEVYGVGLGGRAEVGGAAVGVGRVHTDDLRAASRVGAAEPAAAVGGGGKHEDFVGVGVVDGALESRMTIKVRGGPSERHGNDIDIPLVDRVLDGLRAYVSASGIAKGMKEDVCPGHSPLLPCWRLVLHFPCLQS